MHNFCPFHDFLYITNLINIFCIFKLTQSTLIWPWKNGGESIHLCLSIWNFCLKSHNITMICGIKTVSDNNKRKRRKLCVIITHDYAKRSTASLLTLKSSSIVCFWGVQKGSKGEKCLGGEKGAASRAWLFYDAAKLN